MFELKKIGIVRRASAWLLDAILLAVLATGLMWIVSLICNYDEEEDLANEYYESWELFRQECIGKVAQYYGYSYEEQENGDYVITRDGERSLSDVVAELKASNGVDPAVKAEYDRYLALPPVEQVNRQYEYVHTMLFMMISVGLLLAYMIMEFVIPLCLKNGQTIGKKIFGICLVRPNCVKIKPIALFARTLLGKFAIETMFPVLLVFLFLFAGLGILAIVLFAALLLLNIILFFATKNRTPIHDILAYTVAADMKVQMIFQTEEELTEKKALVKRELIEREKNA